MGSTKTKFLHHDAEPFIDEVVQVDRDAAHALMMKARGYWVALNDQHFAVQAFARFRRTLTPEQRND